MIDLDKPVRTKRGWPVQIIHRDLAGQRPIVGIITRPTGDQYICLWDRSGHNSVDGRYDDLENAPPEKVKLTGWVNVYFGKMNGVVHSSKKDADGAAGDGRLACVPISIEYTPGEGLDPTVKVALEVETKGGWTVLGHFHTVEEAERAKAYFSPMSGFSGRAFRIDGK